MKKKIVICALGILILFLSLSCTGTDDIELIDMPHNPVPTSPGEGTEFKSHAFTVVQDMGVGWNLGNTLDSIDNRKRGIVSPLRDGIPAVEFYETYWGNPVTTFEMIESVAKMGFGAVRIPVTYTDHLDENFNIRAEWLERVEQIVNYVLDNDMYCIINIHHDTGSGSWPWLRADLDNIEWMEEKLAIVWAQIATHFNDYGGRLLFESFNEILDVRSNWNSPSRASLTAVNRLNQVFVDTVRGTGGNNAERLLIVKTYAAGTGGDVLDAFELPDDRAEGRLIVGVHYYGTHGFTRHQEQASWTETYSEWEQRRDGGPVELAIRLLKNNFIDKRIPVIIGEFGAQNKNNTPDRINYALHYIEMAKQHGIVCFWWDDGGGDLNAEDVRNYTLFSRYRNEWVFPEIAEALTETAR